MAQVQQAPATSLVTVTMPELNHGFLQGGPELNATQKMMVDGFLKGGAELLKLVNTEGQHNIFSKGGKLLEIVIEHLVAVQRGRRHQGQEGTDQRSVPRAAQRRQRPLPRQAHWQYTKATQQNPDQLLWRRNHTP